MAKTVAQLTTVLSLNNSKFKAGLKSSRGALNIFQKQVASIGTMLTGAFSVIALARVVKGIGKLAVDFEAAMADVKAITRATDSEFMRLEESAKALGKSTRFTATEVASLQKEFGKLGFSTEEILKAEKATLDLAAAVDSDLGRAAEVAGATLRGFGLDASETQRVTDLMAKSFTMSALDMERFAESMKYVAPTAKAAGISIEQATAMLSKLADAGIHGSMAGTALRNIFSELIGEGGSLEKKLLALSSKGLNLADAESEVGKRSQAALLVLLDQIKTLPDLTKEYENAAGAAKKMADIQLDTVKGQLTILTSAWQGFALELTDSDKGVGVIKDTLGKLSDALNNLTDALKKAKENRPDNWVKDMEKNIGKLGLRSVPVLGRIITAIDALKKSTETYNDVSKLNTDRVYTNAASYAELARSAELGAQWVVAFNEKFGIGGKTKLPKPLTPDGFIDMASWEEADLMNLDDLFSWSVPLKEDFMDLTGIFSDQMPKAVKNTREEMLYLRDISKKFYSETKKEVSDITRQFVNLGSQIASSMGSAIGSGQSFGEVLANLSTMIASAIGDILIAVGMAMTPIGIPLVLAGLGIKLGSGIISGVNSKMGAEWGQHQESSNVNFVIEGDNLVGVLNRHGANHKYRT